MSLSGREPTTDRDESMARAVGLYVLGRADLGEAADRAGVSAWELHEVLAEAGVVPGEYEN